MEQWQLFLPFFPLISPFLSLPLPILPLHVPSAWVIHLSPTQYSTTGARHRPYCHNAYLSNARDFINVFPHSPSSVFLLALRLIPSFTYSLSSSSTHFPSFSTRIPLSVSLSLFSIPLSFSFSSDECKNRTGEALSPLPACRLISIFMSGL